MAILGLAVSLAAALSCSTAFRHNIRIVSELSQRADDDDDVIPSLPGHGADDDSVPNLPGPLTRASKAASLLNTSSAKAPIPLPEAWQDRMLGPLVHSGLKYKRSDLSPRVVKKLPSNPEAESYQGGIGQYWEKGGAWGSVQLFREIGKPDEVHAVKYQEIEGTDLDVVQNEVRIMERVRGLPGVMGLLGYAPSDLLKLGKGADVEAWIEMPYAPFDLKEVISSQKNAYQRAHIFKELANGIKNLHASGVLHNDLKPANVLVGRNDEVYIADFGGSCGRGPEIPCDRYTTTPYFAPQELMQKIDLWQDGGGWRWRQTGDLTAAYTEKVDVYSLGVILAQLALRINTLCGLTIPGQCGVWNKGTFDLGTFLDTWKTNQALQGEAGGLLRELLVHTLETDPAKRWDAATVAAMAQAWEAMVSSS